MLCYYGRHTTTTGNSRACAKRNLKAHIFFLKEENGKVDGVVYSTQYQPSPIPAGGLEILLKLTFKSPYFLTRQKMKDFMANLCSHNYEAKAQADENEDAEIHFMIAKKRTAKWLRLRSRGHSQRFVNHQNQIVRTVKWLNQQLR